MSEPKASTSPEASEHPPRVQPDELVPEERLPGPGGPAAPDPIAEEVPEPLAATVPPKGDPPPPEHDGAMPFVE